MQETTLQQLKSVTILPCLKIFEF